MVENARRKARAVAAGSRTALVIACDTDVVLDGEVLGKPADAAEARAYLDRMSGRAHEVMSGLVVARGRRGAQSAWNAPRSSSSSSPRPRRSATSTSASGEGRSGGYAIQTLGSTLVERLEGSVSNVVGLPVGLLAELAPALFERLTRRAPLGAPDAIPCKDARQRAARAPQARLPPLQARLRSLHVYRKQVRRRRAVLALLIVGSFALLTITYGQGSNGLQRGVATIFSPVQSVADRALKPARDLVNWFDETFDARGENAKLHDEVETLRKQAVGAKAALAENEQLRKLLELDESGAIPSGYEAGDAAG